VKQNGTQVEAAAEAMLAKHMAVWVDWVEAAVEAVMHYQVFQAQVAAAGVLVTITQLEALAEMALL
jgi:hypothetical protein